MKRIVSAFSITLLLSLVSIVPLWAQRTAQINGTVRDQSGAVLPGVEITATFRHSDLCSDSSDAGGRLYGSHFTRM